MDGIVVADHGESEPAGTGLACFFLATGQQGPADAAPPALFVDGEILDLGIGVVDLLDLVGRGEMG